MEFLKPLHYNWIKGFFIVKYWEENMRKYVKYSFILAIILFLYACTPMSATTTTTQQTTVSSTTAQTVTTTTPQTTTSQVTTTETTNDLAAKTLLDSYLSTLDTYLSDNSFRVTQNIYVELHDQNVDTSASSDTTEAFNLNENYFRITYSQELTSNATYTYDKGYKMFGDKLVAFTMYNEAAVPDSLIDVTTDNNINIEAEGSYDLYSELPDDTIYSTGSIGYVICTTNLSAIMSEDEISQMSDLGFSQDELDNIPVTATFNLDTNSKQFIIRFEVDNIPLDDTSQSTFDLTVTETLKDFGQVDVPADITSFTATQSSSKDTIIDTSDISDTFTVGNNDYDLFRVNVPESGIYHMDMLTGTDKPQILNNYLSPLQGPNLNRIAGYDGIYLDAGTYYISGEKNTSFKFIKEDYNPSQSEALSITNSGNFSVSPNGPYDLIELDFSLGSHQYAQLSIDDSDYTVFDYSEALTLQNDGFYYVTTDQPVIYLKPDQAGSVNITVSYMTTSTANDATAPKISDSFGDYYISSNAYGSACFQITATETGDYFFTVNPAYTGSRNISVKTEDGTSVIAIDNEGTQYRLSPGTYYVYVGYYSPTLFQIKYTMIEDSNTIIPMTLNTDPMVFNKPIPTSGSTLTYTFDIDSDNTQIFFEPEGNITLLDATGNEIDKTGTFTLNAGSYSIVVASGYQSNLWYMFYLYLDPYGNGVETAYQIKPLVFPTGTTLSSVYFSTYFDWNSTDALISFDSSQIDTTTPNQTSELIVKVSTRYGSQYGNDQTKTFTFPVIIYDANDTVRPVIELKSDDPIIIHGTIPDLSNVDWTQYVTAYERIETDDNGDYMTLDLTDSILAAITLKEEPNIYNIFLAAIDYAGNITNFTITITLIS